MKKLLMQLAVVVVVVLTLLPLSAQAKIPPGTGIKASETGAGHLTSTFTWTIAASADPASQSSGVNTNATVHWTITTTKSDSGTLGAYLDGQICVTNTGSRVTQGLAIQDDLTKPPVTGVLNTTPVDVSAKPQLNAGETYCYPYTITVPAASIVPGATYKSAAHVTITNQSCCPGTPSGPSPSATAVLPFTPTPIDSSVTVTDTNGQSFTFNSGGSQSYDLGFNCPSTPGTNSLSDTATIQSTGQSASASATVQCLAYPQSNALSQPIDDALASFSNDCVSFFLDTTEAQSGGLGEQEDHHQGLARTPELSDGSVYFFLSHSEVEVDENDRGNLMQFHYADAVDNEHVTGAGKTATADQILTLSDEMHPSDIDFLPDINGYDSGYLFVAKEYGTNGEEGPFNSHKVGVYYWQPGSDFVSLGDIDTGLEKPSHILIDKIDDYYYLVVLDNSNKDGVAYKAYYKDLFPSDAQGSMNLTAFGDPLANPVSFNGDLGSQAQLIRDPNGWHVLVYTSTDDNGNGDDYVYVRDVTFGDDTVTLGDGPGGPPPPDGSSGYAHIILPPGETSFTSTGTHYVDRNGRLLISSSERWSDDRGDPYGYETRVDECQ